MWTIRLGFTDYFSNTVYRNYQMASGANDGTGYTAALTFAETVRTAAETLSRATVTTHSVFWVTPASPPLPPSAECAVKNVLSVSFDLNGKIQKGRITLPCPNVAEVLDSNRQVDLPVLRASDFILLFLDGDILLSDGDTADWMRDADILSQRGKIETE